MAAGGSKVAVVAAIVGNGLVMVAKFVGFAITGSGAMLSEAIHTLADLLNQILLLIGIVRSGREADTFFQYGYGSERYVWALISAVGIFFLGCGVTIYHGISSLLHPHSLESLGWAMGVLIFSLIIEAYVLYLAVRSVKQKAAGAPFFKFMRTEADPATVAVVLEDFTACVGVMIAMLAIGLSQLTGELYWDAFGSILVGILLGGVAIWLIFRNHALLVGPGIPLRIQEQVRKIIEDNPAVEEIVDMRTRVLDTETYRIKADVRFDGVALAERLEARIKAAYPEISTYEEFRKFTVEFADDVVELLADEIDLIEKQIRDQVPKATHLDLEAD